jgi:hypothetical protein
MSIPMRKKGTDESIPEQCPNPQLSQNQTFTTKYNKPHGTDAWGVTLGNHADSVGRTFTQPSQTAPTDRSALRAGD